MKDALSSAIAGANVEPYTDSADFTASKSFSMPLYRKIFAVNYQKEFIEKETDPSVITRLVDEAWFNKLVQLSYKKQFIRSNHKRTHVIMILYIKKDIAP